MFFFFWCWIFWKKWEPSQMMKKWGNTISQKWTNERTKERRRRRNNPKLMHQKHQTKVIATAKWYMLWGRIAHKFSLPLFLFTRTRHQLTVQCIFLFLLFSLHIHIRFLPFFCLITWLDTVVVVFCAQFIWLWYCDIPIPLFLRIRNAFMHNGIGSVWLHCTETDRVSYMADLWILVARSVLRLYLTH